MNITFVTESHPFNDDKQSVDVAEQSALDEANRSLATLRLTSANHERTMKDVARKLKQANEKSSQNTEWIRGLEAKVNEVEARVDALPQALREALDCALKEMLEGKLSLFEKLIANLRQESERISVELEELHSCKTSFRQMAAYKVSVRVPSCKAS